MRVCECGKCGLEVKPGQRFISGHNGRCCSKETVEKLKGKALQQWANPEIRNKMIRSSNNNKQKASEYSKELWQDPEYAKKQSEAHKGNVAWSKGLTKETDNRILKATNKMKETKLKNRVVKEIILHPCECGCGELVKNRFAVGHNNRGPGKQVVKVSQLCECGVCGLMTKPGNKYIKGHNAYLRKGTGEPAEYQLCECGVCEEFVKKPSRFVKGHFWKGYYHSYETKQKLVVINTGKVIPESVRGKIRVASKRNWEDPEYRERILLTIGLGMRKSPNKSESFLDSILKECYSGCKYTGDFSFWINGKNPDFVNEEQKLVIELYGDYWHDGEDPTDRAEIFAQAGYDTLVIWENELYNSLDNVIHKIKLFAA